MLNWHMYSLYFLCIVNALFIFCHQSVTTYDQLCRQCSWLSNISTVLIRTNCNNKVHSLKFSMQTQVWFLISPCRRLPAAVRASNGAVSTAAKGSFALARALHTWGQWVWTSWLQAGPGCGRGQGLRRQWAQAVCAGRSTPRLPARSLPVFWRWRQRRPLMCYHAWHGQAQAPAQVADAEQACCLNESFAAPLYLQTAQLL